MWKWFLKTFLGRNGKPLRTLFREHQEVAEETRTICRVKKYLPKETV